MRKLLFGFLLTILLFMGAALYIYISPSITTDHWKVKLYHPFFIKMNRYDLHIKNLGVDNSYTRIEIYQIDAQGTKTLVDEQTLIDDPGLTKGEDASIQFLVNKKAPQIEIDITWENKYQLKKSQETFHFKTDKWYL